MLDIYFKFKSTSFIIWSYVIDLIFNINSCKFIDIILIFSFYFYSIISIISILLDYVGYDSNFFYNSIIPFYKFTISIFWLFESSFSVLYKLSIWFNFSRSILFSFFNFYISIYWLFDSSFSLSNDFSTCIFYSVWIEYSFFNKL